MCTTRRQLTSHRLSSHPANGIAVPPFDVRKDGYRDTVLVSLAGYLVSAPVLLAEDVRTLDHSIFHRTIGYDPPPIPAVEDALCMATATKDGNDAFGNRTSMTSVIEALKEHDLDDRILSSIEDEFAAHTVDVPRTMQLQ